LLAVEAVVVAVEQLEVRAAAAAQVVRLVQARVVVESRLTTSRDHHPHLQRERSRPG
jgi:hypothetical protein